MELLIYTSFSELRKRLLKSNNISFCVCPAVGMAPVQIPAEIIDASKEATAARGCVQLC